MTEEQRKIENECYLLSEAALAADWNRPEEEAAWAHLQADSGEKTVLNCDLFDLCDDHDLTSRMIVQKS